MTRFFAVTLLLGILLAGACAVNPVSGDRNFVLISEDQEIEIGRTNHPQIIKQFGRYDNEELQRYVQDIGARLAAKSHRPELIYRFTVLDSTLVNAFAMPGGYIYITRGLLAYLNSEAELAAVLGHEIGHVTARHSVRQATAARAAQFGYVLGSFFIPELNTEISQNLFNVIGSALINGYGREQELEADRLGSEYLARSGYDPHAMIRVIGVLKDQEGFERQVAKEENREPHVYHGIFATHPDNDRRLQEVVASAAEFATADDVITRRMAFLRHTDGLVYGDSERSGIRRGNRYYHAGLGIGLVFPQGWVLENLSDRVLARTKESKAAIQLTVEDLNRRISPAEFLKTRLHVRELVQAQAVQIHGLRGAVALADVKTSFGKRTARVAAVFYRNRAFVFVGASKNDIQPPPFDDEFLETVKSLHPLAEKERRLAQPLRLHLLQVTPGMTFAKLAQQSPIANHPESQLRLLNHLYPKGAPQPGQWIKVVE